MSWSKQRYSPYRQNIRSQNNFVASLRAAIISQHWNDVIRVSCRRKSPATQLFFQQINYQCSTLQAFRQGITAPGELPHKRLVMNVSMSWGRHQPYSQKYYLKPWPSFIKCLVKKKTHHVLINKFVDGGFHGRIAEDVMLTWAIGDKAFTCIFGVRISNLWQAKYIFVPDIDIWKRSDLFKNPALDLFKLITLDQSIPIAIMILHNQSLSDSLLYNDIISSPSA